MNFQKVFIFTVLITLTSCGVLKLFVGKLDYYVAKKTASRLNLYVKQEEKLHIDIEKLFDALKPEVKTFTKALVEFPKKDKNVTQTDINIFFQIIKPALENALLKSTTVLAQYLSILSEKQRKEFLTELEEKNNKATKALKKNKYFEHITERFEMLLGKLTPKQKLIFKKYRYTYQRWQEKRIKINLSFEQQLKVIFQEKDESKRLTLLMALTKKSTTNFMATFEGTIFDDILKSYFLVIKNATIDQREILEEKTEFILGIMNSFIKVKYSN